VAIPRSGAHRHDIAVKLADGALVEAFRRTRKP
jgi:uncharacterized protein YwbE